MVVDSIDSVLIGNNYRQRTNLHPLWGGHEEWIEGIGSISGILHNSFGLIGGNYFELLCYYENFLCFERYIDYGWWNQN